MKKYHFRIKEARERKGLTQAELAAKLGVAQNTFCGYENGNHDPKSNKLAIIAKECDTTVDYLVGKTNDPNSYDKTEKSPAPVGTEDDNYIKFVDQLTRMLASFGLINESGDITDEDRRFILSVASMLNTYFENRG